MTKTELRPAYVWTCDECGRDNFCRGIVPELSDEEKEEIRADHGIDPWEEGTWEMMPTSVQCGHCGTDYETEFFDQ